MANKKLSEAKNAKNDEFYTQYEDIQNEVNAYLEYNPDVFRGKTVLLPCDDPEWSNFTKFFAQNFDNFGLKKLISTSYAYDSKNYTGDYQLSFFEAESPHDVMNPATVIAIAATIVSLFIFLCFVIVFSLFLFCAQTTSMSSTSNTRAANGGIDAPAPFSP